MHISSIFVLAGWLAFPLSATSQSMSTKEQATFAGGCFWCTEAIFERIEGVTGVTSGYTGGALKSPTYEAICSGQTGHAEAIQISFLPHVVSYEELLEVFFHMHDPTTLNRQGNDIGTQYRSVIFYHSESQLASAKAQIGQLTKEKTFQNPIVTQLEPLHTFYPAEKNHQDYYKLNKSQPYCRYVIVPKFNKMNKLFKDKIKIGK